MRRPNGEWTTELARQSGYQNGPALPANAQKAITLQMYARDGQLRGRYSLDDGATWTEIGDGFSYSGLSSAGIGLAAYNGTGAEIGTFGPSRSASRRRCRPPRARPRTPPRPATCCSRRHPGAARHLEVRRWRRFVREGLRDQVRRRGSASCTPTGTTRRRTRSSSSG